MTVTTQRRRAALGGSARASLDDDDDGSGPYDPRYPGRKVVADGGRVRVPMHLTDGRPDWMPQIKPALFDARSHQPHQVAVLGDAEMRDARAASEAAYQARNAYLRDAYRTMPSATGGAAKTTAPPSDKPGESPRDAYIRRLSSWPPGSPDDDDDANVVEAQRRRWLSPGATPGSDARSRQTKDAAADRDQAYGEYLDRISSGWRR